MKTYKDQEHIVKPFRYKSLNKQDNLSRCSLHYVPVFSETAFTTVPSRLAGATPAGGLSACNGPVPAYRPTQAGSPRAKCQYRG